MTPHDLGPLFSAALAVRERAYAPYSGFKVGACIRTPAGALHAGANVENAAYPQGQCAEAGAIAAMIAAGEREIAEILVVGGGEGLCTPCGGCRQRIREFARPDTPVHVCGPEGLRRTFTLDELLPQSFGPANLGRTAEAVPGPSALDIVRAAAPGFAPVAGIVTGTGLAGLADRLEGAVVLPYAALPGFPRTGVNGHPGRLVLGRLAGRPVAVLQGRAHGYEGHPADAMGVPIRLIRALGASLLVLTNAAGSLNPAMPPGTLMAIRDQVNLTGRSPLSGPNEPATGPRFPDMTDLYDPGLRRLLGLAAEGVYIGVHGPQYETAAEIDAFRRLGGDAVGMSTVHEAIIARHCGLKLAGISVMTNMGTGMVAEGIDGHAVEEIGRQATGRLIAALEGLIRAV